MFLKPLFIPVKSEVYNWYSCGKEWEVRPCKRRYNERSVFKNRFVNVSRGYSHDRFLGIVDLEPIVGTLEYILNQVPYNKIIPPAKLENEVKEKILSLTSFSKYIAFHIKIIENAPTGTRSPEQF